MAANQAGRIPDLAAKGQNPSGTKKAAVSGRPFSPLSLSAWIPAAVRTQIGRAGLQAAGGAAADRTVAVIGIGVVGVVAVIGVGIAIRRGRDGGSRSHGACDDAGRNVTRPVGPVAIIVAVV